MTNFSLLHKNIVKQPERAVLNSPSNFFGASKIPLGIRRLGKPPALMTLRGN